MITKEELKQFILAQGLTGKVLCVHASMGSFKQPLEAGVTGLIEILLELGNTILVPSFSYQYAVCPPIAVQIPRNGTNYSATEFHSVMTEAYSPDRRHDVSPDMGVFAKVLSQLPDSLRGDHPTNSFCAIGPRAGELISMQSPTDVYAPLRALCEADGSVLLLGTQLESFTLLHLAEQLAGRELFRSWAFNNQGHLIETQVGSCSTGFGKFADALTPLVKTAVLAGSLWQRYNASQVVETSTRLIKAQPGITHCHKASCLRCNDAIAGGPLLSNQEL